MNKQDILKAIDYTDERLSGWSYYDQPIMLNKAHEKLRELAEQNKRKFLDSPRIKKLQAKIDMLTEEHERARKTVREEIHSMRLEVILYGLTPEVKERAEKLLKKYNPKMR